MMRMNALYTESDGIVVDMSRHARRKGRQTPVTVDDVRAIASTLPRSYEVVVYGRVKFRVGSLVYVALSRDETIMGFAFPKELRASLVDSDPDKFLLPDSSDLRFNWVCVRLDAIDHNELSALVISAWRMCVPKKVYAAYASPLTPAGRRRRS
jgi:hypothetical protein